MLGVLLARWRGAAIATLACAVVALGAAGAAELTFAVSRAVQWAGIWCLLGLLVAISSGRASLPPALVWLSDAGYAIYLFQLFSLTTFRALVPAAPGPAGLGGARSVVWLGRRLLGARSLDWLGA